MTHESRAAIYAHRLGGDYGPELSRRALERTLSEPVEGLEADVVLAADGEVFALHDPLLQISTDVEGWAQERPAADIVRAHLRDREGRRSEEHPMRLGELLEAIPRDMPLMLDVKAYADHDLAARTANRSCEIVAEHGTAERAQIVSFFSSGCRAAGDHGVRSRLVAWADYAPQDLARWAMKIGAFGVSFEGFVFSSDLCRALRQQGLSVALGTVNHREQLEALLPLEPEVLVSDCPHELRRVLDEG